MRKSGLFHFAARCLSLDDHPEFRVEIKEKFVSGEAAIDDFIWLCSNEYVLPALFLKFRQHDLLDIFLDEFIIHLHEIYELNRNRNLKILAQMEEVSTLLNHENIPHIYLKGTGNLLDGLYSDVGERMIGDIDFLVRDVDFLETAKLIQDLGYSFEEKVYDDVSTLVHYPRLFRKDVPADIEIHRLPVNKEYSKRFSSELIFQDKKKVPGVENRFVPCDQNKIIQNFIHAQLSDAGHRLKIIPLLDLYDLFLLSKRIPLVDVLPQLEEKEKAESYFVMMEMIMNGESNLSSEIPKARLGLYNNCVWLLDHSQFHRFYIWSLKFYQLVFHLYLGQMARAIFQKSARDHVVNRLKDPEYFLMHLKGLKDFFS